MCCYGDCTNKRVKLVRRVLYNEVCCARCKEWICESCYEEIINLDPDSVFDSELYSQKEYRLQLQDEEKEEGHTRCSNCDFFLSPHWIEETKVRVLSRIYGVYLKWKSKRQDSSIERMLERSCIVHHNGDTTGCDNPTKYFPSKRCPGCKKAMCERCAKYQSAEFERSCDNCDRDL